MKRLLMLGILVVVVACKGGGGGGGGYSVPEAITNGVYKNCEFDSADNMSTQNQVFVDDYYISEVITYFTGANCQSGQEVINERYIYSYTMSGSVYHITVESVNVTAKSSTMVTYNNTNSFCGLTGWVINVPQNILGRNCGGGTINSGESMDITVTKSGNNLTINTGGDNFSYSYVGGFNFASQNQTASNGNYAYYDGSVGVYATLNSGNYTVIYYNSSLGRTYTETGTYTSSNNVITVTPTSYSPSGCQSDVGQPNTKKFSETATSLALQEATGETTLFEKVSITNTQFASAYLPGSYSASCY